MPTVVGDFSSGVEVKSLRVADNVCGGIFCFVFCFGFLVAYGGGRGPGLTRVANLMRATGATDKPKALSTSRDSIF
jgi:hypothetical protein